MGAINDGMRNTCELLINVVKLNRLKVLISLGQNGKGYGWGALVSSHVILIPPANRQALTHCVLKAELGKPVFLPVLGQLTERKTYGNAGRGGWKKRMPTCNGLDTGFPLLAEPDSKESRLPARC